MEMNLRTSDYLNGNSPLIHSLFSPATSHLCYSRITSQEYFDRVQKGQRDRVPGAITLSHYFSHGFHKFRDLIEHSDLHALRGRTE